MAIHSMLRVPFSLFLFSNVKRKPTFSPHIEYFHSFRWKNSGMTDACRRKSVNKNENLLPIFSSSDDIHNLSVSAHHNYLPMMPPSFSPLKQMQHLGETAFTAALLLSLLQASIALYQYRTNSRGELIIPPGLTIGVEDAPSYYNGNHLDDLGSADMQSKKVKKKPIRILPSVSNRENDTTLLAHVDDEAKIVPGGGSLYSRVLFRLNKMALLLLPWIAKRIHYILVRNSHLLHILSIITLANSFDFWRPSEEKALTDEKSSLISKLEDDEGKDLNVIVIGDSLAIGIGCVEEFDTAKNTTLPMCRVENLPLDEKDKPNKSSKTEDSIGPVFPKIFAWTISKRLKRRVHWRSAGCDGGMVDDINFFCSGVIREECQKGHSPDIIIVICGMNDLKKSISNPLQAKSARSFRSSVTSLINDVLAISPNADIIFPALPVQTFNKNCAVNILPLSIFLDMILGFWDSQKKLVADTSPSNVIYLGLTPREILSWYQQIDSAEDGGDDAESILIASDGIHPNRLCYSKWAEVMANKFCDLYESKRRDTY